jgi:hypothetical protein
MRVTRSDTSDDGAGHRLYAALSAKQNEDRCANNVLAFVTHAMNPVRHVGNRDYFESERAKLNGVPSFCGLALGEDRNLRSVTAARTLSESEAMAGALRKALIERKVHGDVLKFCHVGAIWVLPIGRFHPVEVVVRFRKVFPKHSATRR